MRLIPSSPVDRLVDLLPRLRQGELSPVDWIDRLEDRFAAVEADLLAFLPEPGRFERLRREAEALLARFPDPAGRPPFFGLPVGVKDVFHVDGLPTRAGTSLSPELFASREDKGVNQDDEAPNAEAHVVTRLRRAGALILGKVACTELAYFGPGPTRNPHDTAHTPGGSSSGSAAAVAAGLAPLTLGTQTIGSIGRPAAYCGVVGFKPSYDRVSRHGLIPLAAGADHVGWFTADADNAAAVAAAFLPDYREPSSDLPAPTLAVAGGAYLASADPTGRERFRGACERLRQAGLRLVEPDLPIDFERVTALHRRLVAAEFFRAQRTLVEAHGDRLHPKTLDLFKTGSRIKDAELEEALEERLVTRRRLERGLDDAGADLWLSPAAPGPAPLGLDATGDPIMNLPWTHSGLPTLVLPDGAGGLPDSAVVLPDGAGGLPTGLQLAAPFGRDEELLAWGVQLQSSIRPSLTSLGPFDSESP